jgi:hypothetical protein
MTALRIPITADLIEQAGDLHTGWDQPLAEALEHVTGQEVAIDLGDAGDSEHGPTYMATIGQGDWTVVVDLPEAINRFLDERWQARSKGAPQVFTIEVPEWIVRLGRDR